MTTDKKEKSVILLFDMFDHSINRDVDKMIVIGTFEVNIVKDLNILMSELSLLSIKDISDKIIDYVKSMMQFKKENMEIKSGLCGTDKKYIRYTKMMDNEVRIHYLTIGNIRKRDF